MSGGQEHDGDLSRVEVLLIAQVLVAREEDLEVLFGKQEKLAVLYAIPAHFLDGAIVMTREARLQRTRQALINQYSHDCTTRR